MSNRRILILLMEGRRRSRSLCIFFCESGCERNSRNSRSRNLDIVDGGGLSVIWLMDGRGRDGAAHLYVFL